MSQDSSDQLSIHSVLPALKQALVRGRDIVLQAPPGAGKTTEVVHPDQPHVDRSPVRPALLKTNPFQH